MDAIGSLYALAARQHQALHIAQAPGHGISTSSAARVFRRHGWDRLHQRIWSPPGADDSLLRATSAALLAAGPGAAATADTALFLRGVLDDQPEQPTIIVPMNSHVPRTLVGVRVIASRSHDPSQSTTTHRMPATSVARSLAYWCIPPTPQLAVVRDVLITAVQKRATTPTRLRVAARDLRGVPGVVTYRMAVEDALSTGADSPFTRAVEDALRAAGLRPDTFPKEVSTPRATLHPDITFLDHHGRKVCMECDGLAVHGDGRAQAGDHRKDRAYKLAGWDNHRLGWWEFTHGWADFLADLRRTLRS